MSTFWFVVEVIIGSVIALAFVIGVLVLVAKLSLDIYWR
jgi:uncharacterized membrane protein YccC